MTTKEIMDTLENIVTIFRVHEGEISTNDLLYAMEENFNYLQSKRSLENHLTRLVLGELEGVSLIKAPDRIENKKNSKDKSKKNIHLLVDSRISAMKEMANKHKKMMTKEKLMAEEKAFMRLALQAIKDLPTLSDKHYDVIEQRFKLHDINTPYYIESEETEPLEPSHFNTSELIYAITNDCPVEFKYTGKSRKDIYLVEPYKIITFDGLWYLFGKDTHDEATPYKTWRLKYIDNTDIDRTEKHDLDDEVIEKILNKAHSADFVVEDIEKATVKSLRIELKVSVEVVDKIQLPGEIDEILNSDGSRTIICDVSSVKEIDRDIKAWLPHIEIIEPSWYREKVKEELTDYIGKL